MKTKHLIKVAFQKTAIIIVLGVATVVGMGVLHSGKAVAAVQNPYVQQCQKGFFGLEPWYAYMGAELSQDGKCEIQCFNILGSSAPNALHPTCGTQSDIPLILLAVVDDLLRIAGMLAIAFIFYGAFEYVGSQGNSEVTARAQSMIVNALVGLVIAIIAVAAVNFIGTNLGR